MIVGTDHLSKSDFLGGGTDSQHVLQLAAVVDVRLSRLNFFFVVQIGDVGITISIILQSYVDQLGGDLQKMFKGEETVLLHYQTRLVKLQSEGEEPF